LFAYFCKHFNAILAHLHFKGVTHFYHASNVPPYFKKKIILQSKVKKNILFLGQRIFFLFEGNYDNPWVCLNFLLMKQTTLCKGYLQKERTKTS